MTERIRIAPCLWFNKNAEEAALGMPFVGLNGGLDFKFDEAISFQVFTDTQEETDRYWNAIVGAGGQENACGWCRDRFGMSWQIVPRVLTEAINDPDAAVGTRVMNAMMTMRKIGIAGGQADGAGAAPTVQRR